ncbi:hypothetical protein OSK62_26275, partial [Escherichia coli]|nr:hypothetical protein [Escherichia coli]
MEELIEWLLWHERVNKEMLSSDEKKSDFELYLEDENRKISLIKEYLTDYEKLAKDYRDVALKNKLLKIEKMELEGRYIY